MSWIRFSVDLPQHPKVYALARLLKVRRTEAVGLLAGLWAYASKHHVDGDVATQDWEAACDFVGARDAGRLQAALREAGWLDEEGGQLRYHDWEDWQGKLIERRVKDRTRRREERDKLRLSTGQSVDNPRTVCDESVARHVNDTTRHGNELPTTTTHRARLYARLGPSEDLESILRIARSPDTLCAEIMAYLTEMRAPILPTDDQMHRTLRDLAITGERVTSKMLERFLVRTIEGASNGTSQKPTYTGYLT